MNDKNLIEFAVKALILKDNKYLSLHKRSIKSPGFELPGGRMIFGETAEVTIIREVIEETGLKIKPICLVDTWNYVAETRQITGIIYLCALISGDDVTLSEEHDEYEWLPATNVSFDRMNSLFAPQMRKWDWESLFGKVSAC